MIQKNANRVDSFIWHLRVVWFFKWKQIKRIFYFKNLLSKSDLGTFWWSVWKSEKTQKNLEIIFEQKSTPSWPFPSKLHHWGQTTLSLIKGLQNFSSQIKDWIEKLDVFDKKKNNNIHVVNSSKNSNRKRA